MAESYPGPTGTPSALPGAQPRRTNTAMIVLIVILVLLLACCACLAIFYFWLGDILIEIIRDIMRDFSALQAIFPA